MEVTSCEIQTKYKFKINIDLKDIDKEYTVKDDAPFLASNKHFTATLRRPGPRGPGAFKICKFHKFTFDTLIHKFTFDAFFCHKFTFDTFNFWRHFLDEIGFKFSHFLKVYSNSID